MPEATSSGKVYFARTCFSLGRAGKQAASQEKQTEN
jgi:hypothetical protein